MPELPEVEVTRLSLVDRLHGARTLHAKLGLPLRWPLGCETAVLADRRIDGLTRRGKYLWLAFEADRGDGLLLHLGMSGSLNLALEPRPAGPWDHFELATTAGLLRLTDPRRFGAVVWSPSLDDGMAARLLGALGVEPLSPGFDGAWLHERFRNRRVAVKQALLGGQVVVGVGNIYASEALFEARIDPRTRCDRLSRPRCDRLATAVRNVLGRAVALGGSTLRDFRDAHGMSGAFQSEARVYDREGLPCLTCGGPIRRLVQGQRSTYFCPACQKR